MGNCGTKPDQENDGRRESEPAAATKTLERLQQDGNVRSKAARQKFENMKAPEDPAVRSADGPGRKRTVTSTPAPKCPRCDKRVYMDTRVLDGKGRAFHKACLKCEVCSRSLAPPAKLYEEGPTGSGYFCDKHHEEEKSVHVKHTTTRSAVLSGDIEGIIMTVGDDIEASLCLPSCAACGGIFDKEDPKMIGMVKLHQDCFPGMPSKGRQAAVQKKPPRVAAKAMGDQGAGRSVGCVCLRINFGHKLGDEAPEAPEEEPATPLSKEETWAQIELFFAEHSPKRLETVPRLKKEHVGREREFLAALRKKHRAKVLVQETFYWKVNAESLEAAGEVKGSEKLELLYDPEDERTLSSRRRIKTKKLTLEDKLDPSVTRAEQLPPDDAVFAFGSVVGDEDGEHLTLTMTRLVCGVEVRFDVRLRLHKDETSWQLWALPSLMSFKPAAVRDEDGEEMM